MLGKFIKTAQAAVIIAALITCCQVSAAKSPDPELLAEGKRLYLGAGSCVACHMADGKGQIGSIPPLAGSEWLKDNDRSIAISLRGLAGPIKVNGKRYYSAMPPQLMFDDTKLAAILTYVNHAWGNDHGVIQPKQVADARAKLPIDVYTPEKILKAFPFKGKSEAKRNGTYKLDFDDTLTEVTEPVVYRTFMPGASPAAFAVALPGNHYYCWDAGECRLRYVWTKGGFIRGNKVHWSSNGKPVAEFNGVPYYRAKSSLLKPEHYQHLAEVERDVPFYDTSEASDFPITIAGIDSPPSYLGYRLVDHYPLFRYRLGDHEIHETIRVTEAKNGITRSFTISPPVAMTLQLTPNETAQLTSTTGTITPNGTLQLSAEQSASFSVTITDITPPSPTTSTGGVK